MARTSKKPDSLAEDCIRIDGEVYDVRAWAPNHPGGDVVTRFLGRDATGVFKAFHDTIAARALRGLRARNLPPLDFAARAHEGPEKAFEALRLKAEAEGLFQPRRAWFYRRAALILGLIACGAVLVIASPWLWPLSAIAIAVAWQQCGWLSHDFLHHSVFQRRAVGDGVGAIFGGVVLGFSADWWKRKHNAPHALPHVMGADEDIDTMPLLAFSEAHLEESLGLARRLVKLQPLTALPIVAFARLNWLVQSALWALHSKNVPRRALEVVSLLVHHAWFITLAARLPAWGQRIGFVAIAELASGLMTGAVFLVGHNARPMLTHAEAPGFCALQCNTTQNIRAPFGTRWFFGGLDRQVEHHLFPTMPRHNHARVAPDVRALCEAHGLAYVERGFFRSLGDVFGVLLRVARTA